MYICDSDHLLQKAHNKNLCNTILHFLMKYKAVLEMQYCALISCTWCALFIDIGCASDVINTEHQMQFTHRKRN